MAHTPTPWIYGVRRDGSIWMSLGDPAQGEHRQFDWDGGEDNARLIVEAPGLLKALKDCRRRFHAAIVRSGTDAEFADMACAVFDDVISKAEGR